jgi:hypothetical protein
MKAGGLSCRSALQKIPICILRSAQVGDLVPEEVGIAAAERIAEQSSRFKQRPDGNI